MAFPKPFSHIMRKKSKVSRTQWNYWHLSGTNSSKALFWIHTYSFGVRNGCWMLKLCDLLPSYMVQDTHLIQESIARQNCYDKALQVV